MAARTTTADEPEQRVVRQLVEALLFEGLVEHTTRPRSLGGERLGDFDPVYDLQIDFKLGEAECRCVGAIKSFGRTRIAEGSVHWVIGQELRACRLVQLVVALDLDPNARQRLLDELRQTLELCRWNHEHLTHHREPRRQLDFQQLESAIVEGHPYHPCFKTRTGFSLQDHEDYGFEAGNTFQLQWLAIDRRSLRSALPDDDIAFWKRELGELDYAILCTRLELRGGDFDRYGLMPVHPWQLRNRAIDTEAIVRLGAAGDRYHASQSLRTLLNASHPEKANVKLPLDVVCTSTRRNLEGHFVCTAPALSDWLTSLVAGDPFFQSDSRLILLREYAGVVYEPQPGMPDGRLGAIYRESIYSKLEPGEAAAPFTALTLIEGDRRPFIAPWLSRYGVVQWVERLIEVVVLPLWHMLVHHGVAFEAHAQNLVLVHRDGWPEKLAVRDFHEETEIVSDYVREPARVPAFEQIDPFFASVPDDDGYRMASTDALRDLFMDCVYVYNLADLSFLLERFAGFEESTFWNVVRAQLNAYASSGVTERARIERIASGSAELVVESLLKKKLMNGARLDFFEHRVPNPLHG